MTNKLYSKCYSYDKIPLTTLKFMRLITIDTWTKILRMTKINEVNEWILNREMWQPVGRKKKKKKKYIYIYIYIYIYVFFLTKEICIS